MVTGTDCIGSRKSNYMYYTIMMAPAWYKGILNFWISKEYTTLFYDLHDF
jgi:hypothetical protein